jgi:hypothetical protein
MEAAPRATPTRANRPRRSPRADAGQSHDNRHKWLEAAALEECKKRNLLALPAKKIFIYAKPPRFFSSLPAGFPDLYIFGDGQEFGQERSGLAVEFKIDDDDLRPLQVHWRNWLRARNIRRAPPLPAHTA